MGALWVAVLEAKYGGWRGLTEEGSSSLQSIWWRDLKKVIHQSHHGKTLHQQINWKVHAGDKVRFWEDRWISHDQSLAEKYPRLYMNSAQQHQLIGLLGKYSNYGWEWNFSWRRQLFDSEIEIAISFLSEVEGKSIHTQGSDSWVWAADTSGIYSTRSAYSTFWEEAAVENLHECFEDLWKIKIPSKIAVFTWRMLWDRLPTKSNLRARQVQILDMTCPFCRRVEENASHIFIHCIKIQPIWWETMSWINLKGAHPWSIKDHFMQYSSLQVDGIRPRRWQIWWLAVTWSTWQLRNRILFSNATFDGNKLFEDATFLIWTWLHNLEKDFSLHFNQWSSNLRQGFLQ
ncbi:putative ribonuclease H protein [Glycine soja]